MHYVGHYTISDEGVLQRVKEEEKNIVQTVKMRHATWIGHILLKYCLSKSVIKQKKTGTIN
jgi:hypothetical protein